MEHKLSNTSSCTTWASPGTAKRSNEVVCCLEEEEVLEDEILCFLPSEHRVSPMVKHMSTHLPTTDEEADIFAERCHHFRHGLDA